MAVQAERAPLQGTRLQRALLGPNVAGAGVQVANDAFFSTPQSVAPTGIASSGALGTPIIAISTTFVRPTGIPPVGIPGTPTVAAGRVTVAPSGVPSALTLGTPTIVRSLGATGIASSGAFGTPTVGIQ